MKRTYFLAILLVVALFSPLLAARQDPFHLYRLNGSEEGPTLLIFGGIHGNEPGGYFAPAILVKHYRIEKGNLWIAPDLNTDSIVRFRRGIYGDMNRKFSRLAPTDPDYHTVERIKKLILDPRVDLILNLHDGHGFYRREWKNAIFNPKAWGQACIIDQKCLENAKFGNLDDLAQKVSARLNSKLFKEHHLFNVKNTETKMKDEQMRLSLTYFAITHGKPAMAIETSKNIVDIPMKVLYQLRAIEAFMDEIGIRYHRDFDLNLATIQAILNHYGTVVINGNFILPLDGIDRLVRNVPLKPRGNTITYADHPLARLFRNGRYIDVMIGHRRVTQLLPQRFKMAPPPPHIHVVVDGHRHPIKPLQSFEFKERFRVEVPRGYRVNVIGYRHKRGKNEGDVDITARQLNPKYAMDRDNRLYRIEIYKHGRYCTMLIARKATP